MGYTHYYRQSKNFTDTEWGNLQAKVKTIFDYAKTNKIEIDDQDGGEPICDDKTDLILFNGVGENSHETFVINKEMRRDFDFCKTQEKPYDLIVMLVLLAIKEVAPAVMKISSDGDWDHEWKSGQEAYKTLFGTEFEELF